jgi:hypothetical protein
MQGRLGTVALNCLKVGGAGSLLAAPLGAINLVAGEATYAGSLATILIAGAVAGAADRREMSRLTSAARRALTRVKVPGRQAAPEILVNLGSGVMLHIGSTAALNGNSARNEVN